jgi:hypothetical protein
MLTAVASTYIVTADNREMAPAVLEHPGAWPEPTEEVPTWLRLRHQAVAP